MRPLRVLAPTVGLLALIGTAPGMAVPTCSAGLPCERVVPEPMETATFLQFDGVVESLGGTLEAIEDLAPGFLEVESIGTSAGGRPLWVVRVTDESVARETKKQVAISLSVHGAESAGREGGVRYVEDLARWITTEPDHPLYAGDEAIPVSRVLAETEVWIGFMNPDGWAAGDLDADLLEGPSFKRSNDNGKDLNRDYPTLGWLDRSGGRGISLSEPESVAWHALVAGLENLTTAADIHGELTSVNDSFSDMMWPAGQWDPTRQAQELQLAEHMIGTVERKFEEDGVVLQELFGPAIGQRPANVATAYDVVGYDDSGFMGDWFAKEGAVEIDIENFLSHQVPGNAWVGALEQAHVAAVRGNMEAVIVEALLTDEVKASLSLGSVAFVDDPKIVTSDDDANPDVAPGETQTPYSVSRLAYFDDLAAAAGAPVTALSSADVVAGDLSAFDSLVVADMALPDDGLGTDVADYVAALRRFAEGGGQLVLTDAAVRLLADLDVVEPGVLTFQKTNAGHVDFGALDHQWEQGLFGTPSQTFYEVPLGFPARSSAPHHGVAQAAWEAAGGTTVGTVTAGGTTATVLGEIAVGEGSIAIFGAILPTASEAGPHPHGLADYAVTIAGGHVLHRILGHTRA